MGEAWDWKKAFLGLVDPTRWMKDMLTGVRLLMIVIVAYVLVVGGIALWKHWMPKKKLPVSVQIDTVSGGTVLNGDRNTKWGIITF